MIFGMEETENEDVCGKVAGMFNAICMVNKPGVSDCFRVGTINQGASRSVKVLFRSNEAAATALRYLSGLKETPYSEVFLTLDRTPE